MPSSGYEQVGSKVEEKDGAFSQVREAASKLAQEAYDHPLGAAAVVGGAALGIALAAKGKFGAWRSGASAGKDVLLIEDTPYMGKAFKASLEADGHRVTWLSSVSRPAPFTGLTEEGKQLVVDPRRYKFAFVDGDLGKESRLQGEHVVDALRKSGVPSIGTSTLEDLNQLMLRNGARITADKPTILAALVGHRLNVSEAIARPGKVQGDLNAFRQELAGQKGRDMRQAAEAVLKKYLEEGL